MKVRFAAQCAIALALSDLILHAGAAERVMAVPTGDEGLIVGGGAHWLTAGTAEGDL